MSDTVESLFVCAYTALKRVATGQNHWREAQLIAEDALATIESSERGEDAVSGWYCAQCETERSTSDFAKQRGCRCGASAIAFDDGRYRYQIEDLSLLRELIMP